MNVYLFSSTSSQHVRIAIERQMWAIQTPPSGQFRANLASKAAKMIPGSMGLFYLSRHRQELTVPFKVTSVPKDEEVSGVWPGTWHFPFQIETLGLVENGIPWEYAKRRLLAFQGDLNPQSHLSGRFAFLPIKFESIDWDYVVSELC